MSGPSATLTWTVHAFYKFVALPDFRELRPSLLTRCCEAGMVGTVLLAHEGINATVAGNDAGLNTFWAQLRSDPRFADMTPKVSHTTTKPFQRMKVRLKKEIVTLGVSDIDPSRDVGEYVEPAAWNDLIQDPEVVVVDTRNAYEVEGGTFAGAINPQTRSFRQFPAFVKEQLIPHRDKKIATFCTGGIRCEKATAYLRQQGFQHVYHLRGGILKYLAETPPDKSLWKGTCFVFDERESLDHQLEATPYSAIDKSLK